MTSTIQQLQIHLMKRVHHANIQFTMQSYALGPFDFTNMLLHTITDGDLVFLLLNLNCTKWFLLHIKGFFKSMIHLVAISKFANFQYILYKLWPIFSLTSRWWPNFFIPPSKCTYIYVLLVAFIQPIYEKTHVVASPLK